MEWQLAWRLFNRELKQGQLVLIILALMLAVLSVTGLARVSERLQVAINGQASKFIAADRIINSPQPLDEAILAESEELGLSLSRSLQFNSMVYAGDAFQLVTVRAVDDNYPLKGTVELSAPQPNKTPLHHQLWYESRLAGLLNHPPSVELGNSQLAMSAEILRLPDGGFNLFASSPVVLMRLDDVPATGVVQPGSRVTYLYQFAGDSSALEAFEEYAKPKLTSSQRWVDIQSGNSPVASAVKRAERFLLLASLLGIALACAAIGIAAQRYCQRHYDVVAMLKTFGASAKQIRWLFGMHLLLVTCVGVVLGLFGGFLLDMAITPALPAEIAAYDAPIWRPVLLGIATGFISALMFSAFPLLKLLSVPPLRVLQRQLESSSISNWLHPLLSLLAMAVLGWLYSRSLTLTLTVVASVVLLGLLLALMGYLLVSAGRSVGMKTSSPVALALAGLRRRARQNSVQLVGFSSALVLLLTILALRQDLLNEWQQQLPENAPNYFLVNIAPEEVAPLEAFIQSHRIEMTDVYPVIRGRLSAINGEEVITPEQQRQGERGRIGISRELNLTWRETLPPNNKIMSGHFNERANEVSVEAGVAERLGIGLSDKLTFIIDNQKVDVEVASIRAVQWETLQPNFFMIFSKEALAPFMYTSMASFHLEPEQAGVILDLIKQFPTVSIIDVGAMIVQLRGIVAQVSLALTLVLVMVVLASSLVMIAQTEAGMASRQKELAVLRTFGASGSLLRWSTTLEFAILGAVSGVLAVTVSEFALWILKTRVFELQVSAHFLWWWLAPLSGAILVACLGLWRCAGLLRKSCGDLLKLEV
ncbi:ABC transporter permease [Shewanella mangrovi]|uniref:ABC transporter permease n=1 Tax=Shewanella mangrovi TaxID=1515746 RepID=A0A094JDH8_9GAMM|nr:FtsX-like permease family protein [Shewanella mangrovi]KFZ37950.1 ABC transporter permease [Shewanella mangrovi]